MQFLFTGPILAKINDMKYKNRGIIFAKGHIIFPSGNFGCGWPIAPYLPPPDAYRTLLFLLGRISQMSWPSREKLHYKRRTWQPKIWQIFCIIFLISKAGELLQFIPGASHMWDMKAEETGRPKWDKPYNLAERLADNADFVMVERSEVQACNEGERLATLAIFTCALVLL